LRTYRTDAVVLRTYDLGEADLIVVLFTGSQGKVRAVAKGARRPTSRLGAGVQPLTRTNALLYRGRNLDVVTQCEVRDSFPGLRSDLSRTAAAACMVELVDAFATEREGHAELFGLLVRALEELSGGRHADAVLFGFAFKALGLLGYRPELRACAACSRPVGRGGALFSVASGGVVCGRCRRGDRTIRRLSAGAVRALRLLVETDDVQRVEPAVVPELQALLGDFVEYWLERKYRSLSFLAQVRELRREEGGV